MMQNPTQKNDVSTCSKCGVKLTHFCAYIPDKGEACMKCYIKHAQTKELKPEARTRLGGNGSLAFLALMGDAVRPITPCVLLFFD